MPERIIASTDECRLVSVDSLTEEIAFIWSYPNVRIENLYDDRPYRSNAEEEESSSAIETLCDYIEDLEWVDPSFVLISLCCEPAIGRIDVIDTSISNRPFGLSLFGSSPSVNDADVLVFSRAHSFRGVEPYGVGSTPFDARFDDSDPEYPYFSLQSDNTYYSLSFSSEQGASVSGAVTQVSWVGNSKIAFALWTWRLFPEAYPFIGIMDIASQSIVFKSRGNGWVMPTGDADGNLVIAERGCAVDPPDVCDTQGGKIVVLDPDTLMPVHEVPVSESVYDMDLSRGWLLVTFSNGQMGTLDLADGEFTPLAEGIVNAGWME